MTNLAPVIAGLLGFGLFFVFLGLGLLRLRREQRVAERLEGVARPVLEPSPEPQAEGRGRLRSAFTEQINEVMSRQDFAQGTANELAKADLKLTPAEYILVLIASTLLGLLGGLLLFGDLLSLVGGLLGFFFPRFYVRRRQGRRLRAFNNQLEDAIRLLSAGLRAGYAFMQAVERVASDLSPPISYEFERVVREVGLGLSQEDALENLRRRVPSDDLDLLIIAIEIHHDIGGNLAEILDGIAHTIRERIIIEGEIRALTAMQRGSGYILSLLPVAMFLFLYMVNPQYVQVMLTDRLGLAMLGLAAMGIGSGFLIMRRIAAIEV